jgi:dTDP-4-amino-4,6-dideoxygalactose transaminase
LDRLQGQLDHKNKNMAVLDEELPKITGLSTLRRDPRITSVAAYQYVFKYNAEAFGGLHRDAFVAALNAEGVPCDGQFYEAVYNSPIFHMDAARYPAWARTGCDADCPVSWRAGYEEAVWLSHHLFLGSRMDTEELVEAIRKVAENATSLIGFEHPSITKQSLSRAKRAELEAQIRK